MRNLMYLVPVVMLLAVACGPIALYANAGGNSAFKSGDYGRALRSYERAQGFAPQQAELMYNTGNALYRQREFAEARERFQDVLVSADEDIARLSLFNLGNAYFNAFQFENAVEAYKEVLRIDPNDQNAKHNLELSLNQLRLIKGDPGCEREELLRLHRGEPVVVDQGGLLGHPPEPGTDNTVSLSANLGGDRRWVGYRARKNSSLLELSRENHYAPGDYWEPVYADQTRRLILEPEEFYLLTAAEGIRIQPDYAAEMTAYDPSSGELRTQYAGFFDPGFGFGELGRLPGVQPVMEVRAHDVPFMIEHGQKVCTLTFEKMLETPDRLYGAEIGSSYQGQGLILSKHFLAQTRHWQLPLFEQPGN